MKTPKKYIFGQLAVEPTKLSVLNGYFNCLRRYAAFLSTNILKLQMRKISKGGRDGRSDAQSPATIMRPEHRCGKRHIILGMEKV